MSDRYIVDLAGTLKSTFKVGSSFAVLTNRSISIVAGELTGGGDLSSDRTLGLANTGVVAGAYGSSSVVPQITVDVKGRVLSVAAVAITPAAIGASAVGHTHAWTDIVSGEPTTLAGYGITDGVVTSDGRLSDSRAPNGAAGGDLGTSYPTPIVTGIRGSVIPALSNGFLRSTAGVLSWANPTAADVGADSSGTAATLLAAHVAAANPHTVYDLKTDNLNWSRVISTPTTVAGYGIVDAVATSDSRLSDARTPTGAAGGSLTGTYPNPTIAASAIANAMISGAAAIAWSKIDKTGAAPGDVGAAAASHTQDWATTITGKPTTLSGYGITDGVVSSRTVTGLNSISGGGDLTANRTLALVNDAASPGSLRYYGTDGAGAKGWFSLPSVTGFAPLAASYVVIGLDPTLTTERQLVAGAGLSLADGGAGSNVTLAVLFGATGTTVCAGNDARLSDQRAPIGAAGGALTGAYPNPGLQSSAVISALVSQTVSTGALTVDLGTGALPAAMIAPRSVTWAQADGVPFRVETFGFGMSAFNFRNRLAGGTRASPTAVTDGQTFVAITASGHDGTGWTASDYANYSILADGLWSASNHGTYHRWTGTYNGTAFSAEWMRLQNGALVVSGTVTPALQGDGKVAIGNGVIRSVTIGSQRTANDGTSKGHVYMFRGDGSGTYGGISTTGDAANGVVSVDYSISATVVLQAYTTKVTINPTTAATSTATGALVVGGGLGVGGNIFASRTYARGANHAVLSSANILSDACVAGCYTWDDTGSVVDQEGTGIRIGLNARGHVYLGVATLGTSKDATEFSVWLGSHGTSYNKRLTVGSSVTCESVTNSTSTTTGSLIVKGGAGIASDVFIGGTSLSLGGNTATSPTFYINGAAGQTRSIMLLSAGVQRWIIRADGTAESGADAGSVFQIVARTDAGVFIDAPISIARAAGGTITIARPLATTSITMSGNFTAGTNTVPGILCALNAASANAALLRFQSAGVTRWDIGRNGSAEFIIAAYDSGATLIDTPITITNAAGGTILTNRPVSVTATTVATGVSSGTVRVGSQGANDYVNVGGGCIALGGNSSGVLLITANGKALIRTGTATGSNYIDGGTLFVRGGTGVDTDGALVVGADPGGSAAIRTGGQIHSGYSANPSGNAAFNAIGTATLAASITDGFLSAFSFTPTYNGAFTVTRHNYINMPNVAGAATVTDACVIRFDAAAGTHKALSAALTTSYDGATLGAMKVNVNGAVGYITVRSTAAGSGDVAVTGNVSATTLMVGGGSGTFAGVSNGGVFARTSSSGSAPELSLIDPAGAASSRVWTFRHNGGALMLYPANDSGAIGSAVISFGRSGTSAGSVVIGSAALATTATDGFLYLPSSAGAPTGVPTANTGRVPIHIDSTNSRIYAYIGGAWKSVTLT